MDIGFALIHVCACALYRYIKYVFIDDFDSNWQIQWGFGAPKVKEDRKKLHAKMERLRISKSFTFTLSLRLLLSMNHLIYFYYFTKINLIISYLDGTKLKSRRANLTPQNRNFHLIYSFFLLFFFLKKKLPLTSISLHWVNSRGCPQVKCNFVHKLA